MRGLRFVAVMVVGMMLLASCGGSGSSRSDSGSMNMTPNRASGKTSANAKADTGMMEKIKVKQRVTYSKEELRERKKPSSIEGLTQGQLEDMPVVPILPSIFGLQSTESQIDAHAMITAREDVESGLADLYTIQQRYLYVRSVWMSDWSARKDLLQGVKNDHSQYAERLRHAAARNAAWRRSKNARQETHRVEMDRIAREELPVLTVEEMRLLNSL